MEEEESDKVSGSQQRLVTTTQKTDVLSVGRISERGLSSVAAHGIIANPKRFFLCVSLHKSKKKKKNK
jgi:hypothetical protein